MFETTNQLIISDIHTCYPNDIDQPVIYRMRSMVALGQSLGTIWRPAWDITHFSWQVVG